MKLIFQFIKPHKKLFIATVILLIVDVVGALFIPTLAAEMLNMGTSNSSFTELWHTGVQMGLFPSYPGFVPLPAAMPVRCWRRGSVRICVWRFMRNR